MMLTFLDVALGLVLVFATLSVFCSSLLETWSGWTSKRGVFLLNAIFDLCGDLSLYRRLIHHHAISSGFSGGPGVGKPPSYIAAERFVSALLDSVPDRARAMGMPSSFAPAGMPDGLDPQAQELLRAAAWLDNQGLAVGKQLVGLARRNGQSVDKLRTALGGWYDQEMERVAGRYKRSSQVALFAFGLLMATLLNIDTLGITRSLVEQPALRAWAANAALSHVPSAAASAPLDEAAALQLYAEARQNRLPIGFTCLNETGLSFRQVLMGCKERIDRLGEYDWLLKCAGLLLTGIAVSFGAPFWFDLLTKLANLRNTGTPEGTKKR